MMRGLTFCIVALLAHLGAASFDCRRTSQSCTPPTTCDFTSSTCDCSSVRSPWEGYDCGLITAEKGAGACATSDPCSTDGTCYDSLAGSRLCYCTADSYGTNCDKKRLTVACETGKMVIGVNPAGASFTGHAYVQGYRADANCNLAQVPNPTLASDSIPDTWLGYALDLDNIGTTCGDVVGVNTGGKIEFTRTIVVQYESDFLTSIDDLFTAKCVFNHVGALVSSDIAKLDPTALSGNLNEISTETEFSPLRLKLWSGSSPLVSTTPINVGSVLTFTISIPRGAGYESLRLVTAVADNTVTKDLKTLNIVTASCMDNAAYPIFIKAPVWGHDGTYKTEIGFKLKAFRFVGNDEIRFKFTVKVCLQANAADCIPETCNGVNASGFGRKKREASAGEKSITRIITVRDPQSFGQDGQTGLTNSNCQITGQTTAAMVAMGIVIFTLLILCLLLIVRFVSHRNRFESKKDLHA